MYVLAHLNFVNQQTSSVVLPPHPQTPDGQLVEVEDDDVPTDSDDESSDDGGADARGRARTARGSRAASVSAGLGGPWLEDGRATDRRRSGQFGSAR